MPLSQIPTIVANIKWQSLADVINGGSIGLPNPAGIYRLSGYLSVAPQEPTLPTITLKLLTSYVDNFGTRGDPGDGGNILIAEASAQATPDGSNPDFSKGCASVNYTFYKHMNFDLVLTLQEDAPLPNGLAFVGVVELLQEIDLNIGQE